MEAGENPERSRHCNWEVLISAYASHCKREG